MPQSVYIAPLDRIKELKSELRNIEFEKENFFISSSSSKSYWAQNIWSDAKVVKIESIKKAADYLKKIQRDWWYFPLQCIRRTKLIQESLPRVNRLNYKFPSSLNPKPLGSFALLSENEMIYSPQCSALTCNGEINFEEPSYQPPSEAYKKLWESCLRMGVFPGVGDQCVDLGSSPGSWTQALLEQGASVISVDKAALSIENAEKYKHRLSYIKKDAFKLDPQDFDQLQWICSDIICYPEKLLELLLKWKEVHPRAHFIFSIKFQSQWDLSITQKFSQIPNATVQHLYYNKHELCFMLKSLIVNA